jgi:heat shock protein HslJ
MRALMIAAALLAGCAAGSASRQLRGVEWAAVDVNGVPVTGRAPTLRLEEGRASGDAGCNRWGAPYELGADEGIRIGEIESTQMACEPAAMEQEARFLAILRAAQGYSFYGDGSFSIIASDGRAIRFRRR